MVDRQVDRHLKRLRPAPGSRLVVAVSGGPDSTVLLNVLAALAPAHRISLEVAHFHHGIRGASADQDQEFVEGLARRLGLPFHSGRGEAPDRARREKLSIEEAARLLRRQFLEDVRQATQSLAVALGHTADDQAETVLLNLIRGAGPRGLGAMPEYGPGRIIRPLIRVRREAVHTWAATHGIEFRTDPSNVDPAHRRNRVRMELLPLLESRFNPNIVATLAREARLFREVDEHLTRGGMAGLASILEDGGKDVLRLDRDDLLRHDPAVQRAIFRAAVRQLIGTLKGWDGVHIRSLMRLLRGSGAARCDLPDGLVAEREADDLLVYRAAADPTARVEPPAPRTFPIEPGTEVAWGSGQVRVTILDLPGGPGPLHPPDGQCSAWFDARVIPPELTIRGPGPGDRLDLFGTGGRKKLSDLYIDLKVPRRERARRPLVCASLDGKEEILWVVGTGRSRHGPVGAETRRIVQLEWFGDWK